jgi:ABC-type uncharacterized transport system substrate-binding protein
VQLFIWPSAVVSRLLALALILGYFEPAELPVPSATSIALVSDPGNPPRKPTSTELRDFARAGGLISYGADLVDAYRLTGVYVGQILHGAKPAELPAQQSTKIEMVINLKTAKALGVTVPLPLLGRADEVIE